jgi:hypothetical protein
MAGKMVPIANIVSRSEALVVASMLIDAGIVVQLNGEHHASVELISVALGGYLLTVPDWQYEDASNILRHTFAESEFAFSEGLQTAVIKLLVVQMGTSFAVLIISAIKFGISTPLMLGWPFLQILGTPVNPQGRSEYYLTRQRA